MAWLRVVRSCVIVLLLVGPTSVSTDEVKTLRCYECNVWKAGYGHRCDNPRIVEGCSTCMKIETTIYMGYYKDTPRSSNMTTRICGNDHTPHFGSECLVYKMVDGISKRCFCEQDLCNYAPTSRPSPSTLTVTLITSLGTLLWLSKMQHF